MIELKGSIIDACVLSDEVDITCNAKVGWLSREQMKFILPYKVVKKIIGTEFRENDRTTALNTALSGRKITVLIHI